MEPTEIQRSRALWPSLETVLDHAHCRVEQDEPGIIRPDNLPSLFFEDSQFTPDRRTSQIKSIKLGSSNAKITADIHKAQNTLSIELGSLAHEQAVSNPCPCHV